MKPDKGLPQYSTQVGYTRVPFGDRIAHEARRVEYIRKLYSFPGQKRTICYNMNDPAAGKFPKTRGLGNFLRFLGLFPTGLKESPS
ncbi:hypothetical protein PM082_020370 [Marasmius tenuissimus]|nr:hypothetical protein PM082_020370 [Marasmius tenuissimus]